MNIYVPRIVCATALTAAILGAAPADSGQLSQPPRIVLVGDSTVTDEAGWGRRS
jgi:hypothetical protein